MKSIVQEPQRQKKAKYKVETQSTIQQEMTELECRPYFVHLPSLPASQLDHLRETGLLQRVHRKADDSINEKEDAPLEDFPFRIGLLRDKHIDFVAKVFRGPLSSRFVSLDSSQPWMMYWCLHSCDLLSYKLSASEEDGILESLQACWTDQPVQLDRSQVPAEGHRVVKSSGEGHTESRVTNPPAGGFGGGPGQLPHAATTYAAVLVLAILMTNNHAGARTYLASIRPPLSAWLASLQQPSTGSFRMHHDGEIDVRATYCAAVVASLLALEDSIDARAAAAYVASCQTYEGGFGGELWSEAHGGYTFCALAALVLLTKGLTSSERWQPLLDLPALVGWLARRQMGYEGGFQGRTNKLVDGCYSFWQGSALTIASQLVLSHGDNNLLETMGRTVPEDHLLFDTAMLERYILLCAQEVEGGLRDKPSKSRDFYHSCYNLSGLSTAQLTGINYGHPVLSRVAVTHPIYNIRVDRVEMVRKHFAQLQPQQSGS